MCHGNWLSSPHRHLKVCDPHWPLGHWPVVLSWSSQKEQIQSCRFYTAGQALRWTRCPSIGIGSFASRAADPLGDKARMPCARGALTVEISSPNEGTLNGHGLRNGSNRGSSSALSYFRYWRAPRGCEQPLQRFARPKNTASPWSFGFRAPTTVRICSSPTA
jgi:hypothetical protein